MDIGLGEWIGLAVVALVVIGPDKLPRYAAEAGRMLRTLRTMASNAREEVTRELGPEFGNLDLTEYTPRGLVRKHLLEPIDLDDLSDFTKFGDDDPPSKRRSAGGPPVPREGGSASPRPPSYDEDAT